MRRNEPDLSRSVLVVAHPDDEILWFSSILDRVRGIVIAFLASATSPADTAGRERVRDAFPLRNVEFLGLTESGCYGLADWTNPESTAQGMALAGDPAVAALYARNCGTLKKMLPERLAGASAVITHNPWGEYGHEEHVQVHRAVAAVARELRLDVWCSGYSGTRAAPFMQKTLQGVTVASVRLATNTVLARQLLELYIANDCWTWGRKYQWPEHESLLHLMPPDSDKPRVRAIPINYLNTRVRKGPGTFGKPGLFRRLRKRLS